MGFTKLLLDGVTATGAGTAFSPPMLCGNFSVVVAYETAAPTAATIALEGSIDGVTWVTGNPMGSTTDVSAQVVDFHVANKPYLFVRARLSAYTAGACTGVTVKCMGKA